jgi:PAS domain S-box-containing protein
MKLKNKFPSNWLGGIIGALLVVLVGIILLASDDTVTRDLMQSSYDRSHDLAHLNVPDLSDSGVVIIYIDEKSLKDLGQPENAPMDRSLHAKLLNRLTADGAKAVVMDIIFSDPGPKPKADKLFAEAIRENGRVILGTDYNRAIGKNEKRLVGGTVLIKPPIEQVLTFPYAPFKEAAAKTGLVMLTYDLDFTARKHIHYLDEVDRRRIRPEDRMYVPPSLAWATAQLAGLKIAQNSAEIAVDRWVHYYGPPGEAIPGMAYSEALDKDLGFFHDKIVFIGAKPMTGMWNDIRDELRSPYSALGQKFIRMPMVEVHATEYLNLARDDWLKRASLFTESGIFIFTGILFGFGLVYFRPTIATGVAIIGELLVIVFARLLFAADHLLLNWLIISLVQIPCALLYSIVYRSIEWYVRRHLLEEERHRAYAQIQEQAALLDKAQDAIIVHDLNWRAQYWNPSAAQLYGWSFDDVKTKDLKSEVFKTDEANLAEALQEALAQGEWSGELGQMNKEGKPLRVQSRWTLVRDADGKPKSVLVINTDITEQKKLEAQFLRTQRMESIGTLAGGIAHDLNNVLTPILMGVEMMKMKNPDEFTNKMLTTMASSAKRGSDMVKQVLTFARGHEGEKAVLQISHLTKEMQKIVSETFPKTIEFNSVTGDNLWPILGDATQIHQIILNLCVNARDAMPKGGGITMETKNVTLTHKEAKKFTGARPVNYVLLSVTDTGTGIPAEIIDKIFEPFFTTKEIGKGTGLGLSTVISIIKSHAGFLDLKTEVGKGTSFNVYLPAAEATVAAAATPAATDELQGKGETVLVVDDEPAILELTRTMLTHFGYKVVTAMHGADALALFALYKEKIKVVIMDMMMPVMDGTTAMRALRKENPALQFIAISGLMQGDKLKEEFGDKSVVFIPKPFTMEKLLLAVRNALGVKRAVIASKR